ncbi:DUF2505 family protein [Alterisphingorhabdus coralli]|uniref:DUF2505 family protein n=1 Tax=Alterisphingorhabdus coralli TaxID=3071408 RepID=A0AA97I119_9SPHN|nr:DUF2505 family protein [Parasphingorhabdus sp. SCSIO 66989]WOE74913.1 DUF2505 family protein [Parasphingorhabdus sp. SCSIO 66989]
MKQSLQHRFCHPLGDVVSLFLDADFLCQMMADLGNRDIEVTVEPQDDDRALVDMRYTVPANPPPLIRMITGEWVDVHQRNQWSGVESAGEDDALVTAKMTLDPIGKPARGSGRLRFRHDGEAGTLCEAAVEVTCSVPLAASLVEAMIIEDSADLLNREFAYIDAALAEMAEG